jgi:hypothetical protein
MTPHFPPPYLQNSNLLIVLLETPSPLGMLGQQSVAAVDACVACVQTIPPLPICNESGPTCTELQSSYDETSTMLTPKNWAII